MMPVHVGGMMMNIDDIKAFASRHDLWVVEDAAHAFPAAWRRRPDEPWQQCGQRTAAISCFSFYANKTITTGEGGMAVTADADLAARMRLMSLARSVAGRLGRVSGKGSWDYRILAPGYKYNMTDIAAAIGIHQLARAEEMRRAREAIAQEYRQRLGDVDGDRAAADRHGSHPRVASVSDPVASRGLTIDRDSFISEFGQAGVSCSVHWRPLHLHPYTSRRSAGVQRICLSRPTVWPRLVSLPLFSAMRRTKSMPW